jgi:acetylornithine/N-succinyldiaminopimelate aminotransferase
MAGVVVNNYGSLPVTLESGKGAVLRDINGKKYIDFVAGIGVNCLGHAHEALVKAIRDQAQKAIHVSNYYLSDKGCVFIEKLLRITRMERAYFGNSGAEANEAAIKLARKYGWLQSGSPQGIAKRHVIVTLERSFHGRTLASLTATGQDKFHPPAFAPYPQGFRTIKAGDYAALDSLDDTVCALFLECVQGEGGVHVIDPAWTKAACQAVAKAGALVVVDEVQTGVGRTGTFLASEQFGIEPDIVTLAKGLAGGVPAGVCLFRGRARDVFAAGDHQSTFAGNPLVCAAALVVLDELFKDGFFARVKTLGQAIKNQIAAWNIPCVTDVRGMGLMIGIDVDGARMKQPKNAADIQKLCLDYRFDDADTNFSGAGLCVSTAGENTLRFLPPLVISDKEVEAGLKILKQVLSAL